MHDTDHAPTLRRSALWGPENVITMEETLRHPGAGPRARVHRRGEVA